MSPFILKLPQELFERNRRGHHNGFADQALPPGILRRVVKLKHQVFGEDDAVNVIEIALLRIGEATVTRATHDEQILVERASSAQKHHSRPWHHHVACLEIPQHRSPFDEVRSSGTEYTFGPAEGRQQANFLQRGNRASFAASEHPRQLMGEEGYDTGRPAEASYKQCNRRRQARSLRYTESLRNDLRKDQY